MQTPDDISRRDLIVTDAPHVGALGWSNSFSAFNNHESSGFQTLLGWLGDLAQTRHFQRTTNARLA